MVLFRDNNRLFSAEEQSCELPCKTWDVFNVLKFVIKKDGQGLGGAVNRCWVPRSIMKVKTMINLICSELCFDGTHYKLQNRRSELVLNFIYKTFFVYCVQNFF